jgi:uncharacterized protein YkwD
MVASRPSGSVDPARTRESPDRMSRPTFALRRLHAIVAFAVVLATAVGLLVAGSALGWEVNSFSAGSESQLIALQNQARASGDMRTLKLDTALRTIARWRSKDMVQRDYFSHTIPGPGADRNVFWYMQFKYDYCFKLAGENIGQATWPGASEEDVTAYIFGLFMDSSGHRANIMGTSWDVVAVGAYRTTGDHYVWTVLFADKCGGSTVKATPKPTPKPTHKATPRPTERPTARPTPKPTREPAPTDEPLSEPTATAGPTTAPEPAATPTTEPEPVGTPEPVGDGGVGPEPTASPDAWNGGNLPAGGLRITDPPAGPGLVDSILSSVTAQFFGGW